MILAAEKIVIPLLISLPFLKKSPRSFFTLTSSLHWFHEKSGDPFALLLFEMKVRAKLRQINGEETHRATIDCVSTMAANEAKWVKQIIIRGLMCVTVKFDTIIHYKVCMDKISIYLHHLLNNEFTYLHSETLCARIFISMRNSLDGP